LLEIAFNHSDLKFSMGLGLCRLFKLILLRLSIKLLQICFLSIQLILERLLLINLSLFRLLLVKLGLLSP